MSETRPHVNPYLRPEPPMAASRLLSALCYPLLPQTAVSFKKPRVTGMSESLTCSRPINDNRDGNPDPSKRPWSETRPSTSLARPCTREQLWAQPVLVTFPLIKPRCCAAIDRDGRTLNMARALRAKEKC